jgi:hypothetical protein
MREVSESAQLEKELPEIDLPEAAAEAEPELVSVKAAVVEKKEEEDLPQTQMAAAFAALNLDDLTSDTPPEETKA